MSGASYVSVSLAAVLERSLDTTANNIANMSTAGFKASRPILDSIATDLGGIDAEVVNFVREKGHYIVMEQGAATKTGDPLNIAMSGTDWFGYQTEDGTQAYGRDGQLVLTADGKLTTTNGSAILDQGGGEIFLPPNVGSNVSIARDGTIADGEGNVLAQIGRFSTDNPNTLKAIGGGLYVAGGGAKFESSFESEILQGHLEQSNVNGTLEITRLIEIQRAYERAVKVIDQSDELSRTAIQRISRNV